MNTKIKSENIKPFEPEQVGPNGFRVGYDENGDWVEWIPDEDNPADEWPLLLRRSDSDIDKARTEFWQEVWLYRNVAIRGEKALVTDTAKEVMKRWAKEHGTKIPILSDFELGLLNGRMSALTWVLGEEWDESLDT